MSAALLAAPTPAAWVDAAAAHWQMILTDHANCEKKAASTALALIFSYPEDTALAIALARLAREELRHFEQVARLMQQLGVPFERQQPGRYATALRRHAASAEPGRKVDLLLIGALIEARSCERFDLLRRHVHDGIRRPLYDSLFESEARHHSTYVRLARHYGSDKVVDQRLAELAAAEAEIIAVGDDLPRMHS